MSQVKTIDIVENVSSVAPQQTSCSRCVRSCAVKVHPKMGNELAGDFKPKKPMWDEWEVVQEAKRCLYCGLPGCVKSCPTSVNMKEMLHSASVRSWYHAGKILYSANPLAAITSYLCECEEEACQSGCNLAATHKGAIKTNEVQKFVAQRFLDFRIPASKKPCVPDINDSVAIIGAGPAGISTATFLARAGFKDITIYEKNAFVGGLVMSQISEHRVPRDVVNAELRLLTDIGVKIRLNTEVDEAMFAKLRESHKAVVIAVGKPEANKPRFEIPKEYENKVFTSKAFLEQVNKEHKFNELQTLNFADKNVVVFGAGNTAFDCCECAYRLGAKSVRLVIRRQFKDIRGASAGIDELRREGVEFLTLREPCQITENGALLDVMRPVDGKPGIVERTGKKEEIEADILITCFGANVPRDSYLHRYLEHPKESNLSSCQDSANCKIYVGGDFGGSVSVVEAVNDGRTIASNIYKQITGKDYCPSLAEFHSDVDDVDISIDVAGSLHFKNPFMISSAPISLTYHNIRNCFLAGFGGAVTKTICLTKDVHIENSLRIFKLDNDDRSNNSYYNNCMISDHPHEYWLDVIKKLKHEFPDRILIASIMCSDDRDDWTKLAKLVEEAGADAIEMNLSCPNQCAAEGDTEEAFSNSKKAMAMALGQDLKAVERTTRYVSEAVKIPVFTKLTPNTIQGNIEDYAIAAIKGGAAGVSYSNTISSVPKVLLDGTAFPLIGGKEHRRINIPSGGYSGSAIRPIILNGIGRIYRKFKEDGIENSKFILGIGGIDSGDAAMQYIHMGASALQVCSACQTYSYEIVQEMKSGMQFIIYANEHIDRPEMAAFIHGHSIRSAYPDHEVEVVNECMDNDSLPKKAPCTKGCEGKKLLASRVGLGNRQLDSRAFMQHTPEWMCKANIDPAKCIRCGTCMTSCRDNANNAIVVDEKGIVRVDTQFCIGCALCSTVCPTMAIRMMEVADPKERKMNYRV